MVGKKVIKKKEKKRKIIDKDREISKVMSRVVYWTALLVSLIGNLVISAALIPFLIVLNSIQLYVVISVLALSFLTYIFSVCIPV